MNSSFIAPYISLILILIIYYYFFYSNSVSQRGLLLLAVVILQTLVTIYFDYPCAQTSAYSILPTIVFPWIILFGGMLYFVDENMKSPFANVFGYWYVKTFKNAESLVRSIINGDDMDVKSLELIRKIYGNPSHLINNFTPSNFNDMWKTLVPLMKTENKAEKDNLLHIVHTKDMIAEAFWVLYTGLLITAYSQYEISNINCKLTPAQQNANMKEYQEMYPKTPSL